MKIKMSNAVFSYASLKKFTARIFLAMGCSQQHTQTAAKVLIDADLRGIASHGIGRLMGYVQLWEKQKINTAPTIQITHETPSTAVIEGDKGLGLVVAPHAMEVAIKKATKVGTGWVAVKNSNHYGIASFHAMLALEKDMIGLSMTNASPLVAPTFSTERLLGTNPIAVAIPADKYPPFIADFATTTVANGKLTILQQQGKEIPLGWLQDEKGVPTNDPTILKKGGSLLPLGSDFLHGSHKGYALGAIVDILSGILSGANYGPWVPPFVNFLRPPANTVGEGVGHFLGAIRIDAFRPVIDFKKHMDQWIARFRAARVVEGCEQVRIPGDYERETSARRKEKGIPVLASVVQDLNYLAKKFAIAQGISSMRLPT